MQAFIAAIVDVDKELAKLQKQRQQLLVRINSAQKKLANDNFVQRAKPEVVERERKSLAACQGQLAAVEEQIKQEQG